MTDQFDGNSIPRIPLKSLTNETRDFLLEQTKKQIEGINTIRERPHTEGERVRLEIASSSSKLRGWFVAYGAAITLTSIQGSGAVAFFPAYMVLIAISLTCVSFFLILADVWYDPHRCLHDAKRWAALAKKTDPLYAEVSNNQAKLVCWPEIQGEIIMPELPKLQLSERTWFERIMDKALPVAALLLFLATLVIVVASVTGIPNWHKNVRQADSVQESM